MSAVDMTYAVNAAAEYQFGIDAALLGIDAERLGQAWDDAKPAVKHAYRESVLGVVAAAAPVIEAAVRASSGGRIRAYSDALVQGMDAPLGPLLVQVALHRCERIARGEVTS